MLLDHGTRSTYAHGCRCLPCRAANAAYSAARRHAPPPALDLAALRSHLADLRARGLGYRQLAALAHVAPATVRRTLAGTRPHPATAAALQAIPPILAHGCTVPGTKTWRYLDSLRREGYTHRELAFRLGARSQQLQLHPRVRVRSALKVSQLHATLTGDRRPA